MKTAMLKFLLMVAVLTFLTGIASAYPRSVYADVTHCGTLATNQTWAASANVHVVTCDVTIQASVTLTIEAGAIVKFQNGADIIVNGKLAAQGTSGSPIYFTSYYDDTIGGNTDGTSTAPAVGNWGHIRFNDGSDDTSIITRAVIRYSGNDYGSIVDDGAIFLSNASPQLSYITFTDNYINGVEIDNVSWTTDTWDNTTMIYVLEEGDVTVPALNTLTINPGMKIKLNNDVDIRVDGKLVVPGISGNPVYFSSVFDDTLCGVGAANEAICDTHNDLVTAPAVGNWGTIVFSGGSDDTSIITRAVIRYSGSDSGSGIDDGPFTLVMPHLSYPISPSATTISTAWKLMGEPGRPMTGATRRWSIILKKATSPFRLLIP